MKFRSLLSTTLILAASALCANAATFHPIAGGVSQTAGSGEHFDLVNLIQGSGVGFGANVPHDRLGVTDGNFAWVTDGNGSDYFEDGGVDPVLIFDLGSDVLLSEISTWGYTAAAAENDNGARDFSLRFATDVEGTGNFATSITYTDDFVALQATSRDSNVFAQNVTARYVEMTITDNYFGGLGGGDRVGLSEVAFATPAAVGPSINIADEVMPALALDAITDFAIPVANDGDEDLTISIPMPEFTGPNAAAFSVTSAPAVVSSQSVENIEIQFDPAGLSGPISATLQVTSNDPDTPDSEVLITSLLPELGPDIAVPIEVAVTGDGAAETLLIQIDNLGQTQLNLTVNAPTGTDAAAFSVVSAPTSIAALSNSQIEVAFDPTGRPDGELSATLTIDSNDPDTPSVQVLLTGGIPFTFYPLITSAITSATVTTDFFPVGNLIQGVGIGFDSNWPHDALPGDALFLWVTDAPNGGGAENDYFDPLPDPAPVIVIDLGEDVPLAEISFWGYDGTNGNGVNSFALRFATAVDGPDGSGTSITYNPTFAPALDPVPLQSFAFDRTVVARYVEWVPLDNFFGIDPPGAGGDRVGAGEIAFRIVPSADAAFAIIEVVRNSPTSISFTFRSSPGITYAIDRTTDLANWGNELTDDLVGAQGTTTFTDDTVPEGSARVFYRVRRL